MLCLKKLFKQGINKKALKINDLLKFIWMSAKIKDLRKMKGKKEKVGERERRKEKVKWMKKIFKRINKSKYLILPFQQLLNGKKYHLFQCLKLMNKNWEHFTLKIKMNPSRC